MADDFICFVEWVLSNAVKSNHLKQIEYIPYWFIVDAHFPKIKMLFMFIWLPFGFANVWFLQFQTFDVWYLMWMVFILWINNNISILWPFHILTRLFHSQFTSTFTIYRISFFFFCGKHKKNIVSSLTSHLAWIVPRIWNDTCTPCIRIIFVYLPKAIKNEHDKQKKMKIIKSFT